MCTNEKENPLGRLYVIMRVDVNMCMSDHLRVHRNAKMETSVAESIGSLQLLPYVVYVVLNRLPLTICQSFSNGCGKET